MYVLEKEGSAWAEEKLMKHVLFSPNSVWYTLTVYLPLPHIFKNKDQDDDGVVVVCMLLEYFTGRTCWVKGTWEKW